VLDVKERRERRVGGREAGSEGDQGKSSVHIGRQVESERARGHVAESCDIGCCAGVG
jgi:hypothetical protein